MRKKIHSGKLTRAVLFLLAATALLAVLGNNFPKTDVFAATSADLKKQIQALESKLDKNRTDQAKLRDQIAGTRAETASLEQQIANLDAETTLIDEQLTTIEEISAEWKKQRELKEREVKRLEKEETKQRDRFARMLRMSYEYGSDSYLELIFGAEDFGDFLMRLDLISYHLSYNEKVLVDLKENQESLKASRLDYEESSAKLSELYQTQEELKITLERKTEEARLQKNALYSKMITLEDAALLKSEEADKLLKETQERSAELKIVSAREAAEAAAKNPAAGSSGRKTSDSDAQFLWPVPDNHTRISSGFVNRSNPVTGKWELHNGIDIPAPARTPIYAADGGTVVIAKWNGGFGNCVTINHGDGYITLYGHCSSLNVTAGQVVNRGDVIAYVGSTGISTGNHLHFTVYLNGTAVDPTPYL